MFHILATVQLLPCIVGGGALSDDDVRPSVRPSLCLSVWSQMRTDISRTKLFTATTCIRLDKS